MYKSLQSTDSKEFQAILNDNKRIEKYKPNMEKKNRDERKLEAVF